VIIPASQLNTCPSKKVVDAPDMVTAPVSQDNDTPSLKATSWPTIEIEEESQGRV
jgi:hypothetical protein